MRCDPAPTTTREDELIEDCEDVVYIVDDYEATEGAGQRDCEQDTESGQASVLERDRGFVSSGQLRQHSRKAPSSDGCGSPVLMWPLLMIWP